MVHTVADQVHQRIAQLINNGLIQLRLRALDRQLDILPQIARQVVDQAAEFLKGGANGRHSDVHRVLAQGRGQPFNFFGDRGDLGIVVLGGNLAQTRLHRHQFAHQVHKLVQLGGGHAQAGSVVGLVVDAAASGRGALLEEGRGGRARLAGRL